MASQVARQVGANIVRHRQRSGLTQHQLAIAVGVQANQVSRWERGEHRPNDDTLAGIGRALGVTLADLYADGAPRVA